MTHAAIMLAVAASAARERSCVDDDDPGFDDARQAHRHVARAR